MYEAVLLLLEREIILSLENSQKSSNPLILQRKTQSPK